MSTIHSTALVDRAVELADDVQIGAYTVIEGRVKIGRGTIILPPPATSAYPVGRSQSDALVQSSRFPGGLRSGQNAGRDARFVIDKL